ncbi:DUF3027 domain-containing protein [Nocardia asiatica]|uniref:DUF3027 domain-containing protein n=1 Tax=Nocardia asiatica TaxID=209252 RepID=UPI002453E3F2|nr:DUF3027 domain-containing protein [Nocardia asiatica]
MSAVSVSESGVRPILADAVDLARRALLELEPSAVGAHLGVIAEDECAATHRFEATLPGYRGWQWAVVVAAPPGADHATVSESALLPGPDALVAPEFVPWEQRVRPGDLAPGDLLAPPADDPRLVPGYVATGDPVVDEAAYELGLGRAKVMSREGRAEAAERWYAEHGPDSEMAKAAPATCGSCGFYLPLAGALRAAFGVCGNVMGADGRVVHVAYGCGAHSDTEIPAGSGSPLYEAYDDAAIEVIALETEGVRAAAPAEVPVDEGGDRRGAEEASSVPGASAEEPEDVTGTAEVRVDAVVAEGAVAASNATVAEDAALAGDYAGPEDLAVAETSEAAEALAAAGEDAASKHTAVPQEVAASSATGGDQPEDHTATTGPEVNEPEAVGADRVGEIDSAAPAAEAGVPSAAQGTSSAHAAAEQMHDAASTADAVSAVAAQDEPSGTADTEPVHDTSAADAIPAITAQDEPSGTADAGLVRDAASADTDAVPAVAAQDVPSGMADAGLVRDAAADADAVSAVAAQDDPSGTADDADSSPAVRTGDAADTPAVVDESGSASADAASVDSEGAAVASESAVEPTGQAGVEDTGATVGDEPGSEARPEFQSSPRS